MVPNTEAPTVELAAVRSTGFDPAVVEGLLAAVPEQAAVDAKPWEGLDPDERAIYNFTLRINSHDLAILRWLASQSEDLSMQKIIKRILVPEIRRRVGL
jgi:hypothetical protein